MTNANRNETDPPRLSRLVEIVALYRIARLSHNLRKGE